MFFQISLFMLIWSTFLSHSEVSYLVISAVSMSVFEKEKRGQYSAFGWGCYWKAFELDRFISFSSQKQIKSNWNIFWPSVPMGSLLLWMHDNVDVRKYCLKADTSRNGQVTPSKLMVGCQHCSIVKVVSQCLLFKMQYWCILSLSSIAPVRHWK